MNQVTALKGLIETTGGDFPAHTYFLNADGKLAAYINVKNGEFKEFTKPMMFYKSGRTFKKVAQV